MGLMICGKCESESTYYESGGLACMKCGNRSPSRWGFHRKDEEIKPPEPIEEYTGPALEDEEEINMGKMRTPEQRQRIAAGIRAAMARKKAGFAAPAADSKPNSTAATAEPKSGKVEIPNIRYALTPEDPHHVLLDFALEENKHLLEPWTKYARTHRRGPGDQVMMAVEEILTNEGLL